MESHLPKTKTTSKSFFASLIIHLIGFLILNLIFRYSPPQYRGSDPLSKETMSPVEILFEMPKEKANEPYTQPTDTPSSLRKIGAMEKVPSIQGSVPPQNASEIPTLMTKLVLPSFKEDASEKSPQSLADIIVKTDIADFPDIKETQRLNLFDIQDSPDIELRQAQIPSFPQKVSLPYSDIQWYPVYCALEVITFNPSVVPERDVGIKIVPKWLEETVAKKEKQEISLVFVVNIRKDMKAKMPGLKEYLYSIVEHCQKYYPNLLFGLVHRYHFSDGTTKYYGLTKNIEEFNRWLSDMVDAASLTIPLQNSRATLDVNWSKIFINSGQKLGNQKIVVSMYDLPEKSARKNKMRNPNWDESLTLVSIHMCEYLDIKPKIKLF